MSNFFGHGIGPYDQLCLIQRMFYQNVTVQTPFGKWKLNIPLQTQNENSMNSDYADARKTQKREE